MLLIVLIILPLCPHPCAPTGVFSRNVVKKHKNKIKTLLSPLDLPLHSQVVFVAPKLAAAAAAAVADPAVADPAAADPAHLASLLILHRWLQKEAEAIALDATKKFGATSPEARLAWDVYEEVASADNSIASRVTLDEDCDVSCVWWFVWFACSTCAEWYTNIVTHTSYLVPGYILLHVT